MASEAEVLKPDERDLPGGAAPSPRGSTCSM